MNIGIFSDTYTPQVNGVVTVIRTLKSELEKRGHRAYVFTVQHPSAVPEEGVFRVKSFQFLNEPQHRIGVFIEKQIIDIARPLNLDIINTHSEFSLLLASRGVSRKLNIPSIHTLHTYYPDYLYYAPLPLELFFKRNLPTVIRMAMRKQKCVISPSKKNKLYLESVGIQSPIKVIPNGIDITQFYDRSPELLEQRRALRERFHIGEDDELIVFVGRLGVEKNVNTLLDNFKEIYARRPRAKLLLVGDGPDRSALQRHSYNLGVSQAVFFAGYQQWPNEIKQAYAAADLFMSASHSEVHPITFIEAMASGLPIVAAADSSIEDMVINGQNGYAVEEDTRMWEKAVAILADPVERLRMSDASVEISQNYSVDRFVDSMIACYEEYRKP